MWRALSETEKNLISPRIDSADPSSRHGTNALGIYECSLAFYPGTRLLRVSSQMPAVGNRYFIERGDDLIPVHRLPDAQSWCDHHFGLVRDSSTALDYFRFAHFFSAEGLRTSLVETPDDLRLDPRSWNPEQRRAAAFVKPPEIREDEDGIIVSVCTFDEKRFLLHRDRYRLRPGRPLELLSRQDSGIDVGRPFHDRQLKIGRSDP